MTDKQTRARDSAVRTVRAAQVFTRRRVLSTAAAAMSVAATGPWYVRDALSSSGECRVFIWTGYFPDPFVRKFEESTGIKLRITELGSNEQLLNKLKGTRGRGYDLITPTHMRAQQWRPLQLLQPWELERLPVDNLEPRYLEASARQWTWDYGQFHLPHLWGTEALGYRTDLYRTEYGRLSLGDLWAPDVRGSIMGRPHSLMAGVGRYLASMGKLPPFEEAYENEDRMREIWNEITGFVIDHRSWIKLFWNDANTQKTGFLHNGIILGQTWDGPVIELKNAGKPINYLAPKEGAFAWLDGFSLPIGATNVDQAYELVRACYDPENAGIQASISGYNPTVRNADAYLTKEAKKAFDDAYPGDALEKLWWWPSEPQWYADIRSEYRDRFLAA